ncbi:MAG TPA: alpha/beta hydrolase, partial [Nitrospiraceae bacterium]|nr:alpha/beta hydrolase [Nitrospiraceae bacterium]
DRSQTVRPNTAHTASSGLTTEQVRRRRVNIDGVTLSTLEAGTGDPVIFVHGVVTTSNIFPKYLNAYSPGYRGIAVDLRGYGDSEKPEAGFTIDQFSKDLIKLADALHLDKPIWVGVSMGGMILQRLALDNPSRVRALVLVSTTDGAMILDQHIQSIGAPRDYREVSKNMIVESFPPGTDPSIYQPLLDRIPTWNATVIRQALTSMSQFNTHGQLSRINVPTLIMVGAKDDVATPAIAKGIQEQIHGAQLVQFDTGHFMMAEDAERFRAVLGEFLRSLNSKALR